MKENEIKQKRQDMICFKEVLELFYRSGKDSNKVTTYSEIVKYIYENNLYSNICNVIDNEELKAMLDKNALFGLSQIIRIYILTYNKKEKIIFDYLYNYNDETFDVDFEKFKKKFSGFGFPTVDQMNKYITRFSKLNLIKITKKSSNKIINGIEVFNKEEEEKRNNKEKEKEKYNEGFNKSYKLALYVPTIQECFEVYKKSQSLNEACKLIKAYAQTFYRDIHFIIDDIDPKYRQFAIKLADYNYNKFLVERCKINLLTYKYTDVNDLCEHIFSNYNGQAELLCKRFEEYISLSPSVNENQIKFIRWVEKVYTNYYEKKKKEVVEQKRKERNLEKLDSATHRIEQYISSNLSIEVNKAQLEKDLEVLQACDHPLYDIYNACVARVQLEKEMNATNEAKQIAELLETGIEKDGVVRKFDMIDYCLITKHPFQELLSLAKNNISYREHYVLVNFMKKRDIDFEWNDNYIQRMYSWDYVVDSKYDEKNNLISGRVVLLEEKQAVISMLKKLEIPINKETYGDGINRLLNGILYSSLEEQVSSKIKVK